MGKTVAKSKAITLGLLAVLATSATEAADIPDMVGIWRPTGQTAAVQLGDPVSGWSNDAPPTFNPQPRPIVVIERQDGRGLGGHAVFGDGLKEPFVGVFRRNGTELMVSTIRGIAFADVEGDTMEWCWLDNLNNVAVASCDVVRREPPTNNVK
ncbi:hypothetical protein ACLBXM_16730 [Xanthobacteraceae bacterium A53D]